MPRILGALIPTAGTLLLGPILSFICLVLFPFAVITTYIAFVALVVRAALVNAQVIAALVKHQLGLDDDYTSTSAWTSKHEKEEMKGYVIQRTMSRRSLINGHAHSANLEVKARSVATESLASSSRTIALSPDPTLSRDNVTSLPSTSGTTSPTSPSNSRPGSNHSSFMARDYEGVGGWCALPAITTSKPEMASANLEWLVMNARLELPNADPSSSTRPRTPEERNRSSSIGGRSHRSMISLSRRNHHRTSTSESIEISRPYESTSVTTPQPQTNGFLERSISGILAEAEADNTEGIVVDDRQAKHRSMISLSEKGSRLAYKLSGWRPLGLKKKPKNDSMSSPEESANEESRYQDKELARQSQHTRREGIPFAFVDGGASTPIGSDSGIAEGVEPAGGLTMWMNP